MVLASKLSSPVPFQQDKNFHQSFASWVKQGQANNSSGEQLEDEERFSHLPFYSSSSSSSVRWRNRGGCHKISSVFSI